ncbi:MAG: ATP-dependent DNA helicase [Fimbriimonadales bacterium]
MRIHHNSSVPDARDLIQSAFECLSAKPGFVARDDQQQLAMLIGDCIEGGQRGLFEAPTGLGKSLAALIPAIAHAVATGKRIVIATYTNVLSEQYWRQDLPLALSLFTDEPPKCSFLIGRQRYACRVGVKENAPELMEAFVSKAQLGIETEFRKLVSRGPREMAPAWMQIATPPVCPARLCPEYDKCFYYKARRQAESAQVLITNHSVVMQDAILRRASQGDSSLIGDFDFLVIDEGHDFANAAEGALEFELSENRLGVLLGVANKLEQAVLRMASEAGAAREWMETCESFRVAIGRCASDLKAYALGVQRTGLLAASPPEVWDSPQVRRFEQDSREGAQLLATSVSQEVEAFLKGIRSALKGWKGEEGKELAGDAREAIRSYELYLREFGWGCEALFKPQGVSVSYANRGFGTDNGHTSLRHDTVGIAEPLKEMLWDETPFVCMSATLALDGDFDFFKRTVGAEADFEEVLPSPFDFHAQAALYLPPVGAIPDPSQARKDGMEDVYYNALGKEIGALIRAAGGRTLALFHSRKEMEAVLERTSLPDELPIYVQRKTGVAAVGERFRENVHASLFALRSFWTGFDAPGETLSCVILVRVPFEVPVDPPQIVRQAWLLTKGLDPFGAHSLPLAKMIMRQGAGRLIRRSDDRGVIAILDPRLRSKRYGEEILRNLPENMRTFNDPVEAFASLGIGGLESPPTYRGFGRGE